MPPGIRSDRSPRRGWGRTRPAPCRSRSRASRRGRTSRTDRHGPGARRRACSSRGRSPTVRRRRRPRPRPGSPASATKHGLPSTGISARIPASASALGDAVKAGVGGDGNSPITSPAHAAPSDDTAARARTRNHRGALRRIRSTPLVRRRAPGGPCRTEGYARRVPLSPPRTGADAIGARDDRGLRRADRRGRSGHGVREPRRRRGEPIASFDVDSLNDYRARRPVLDVVDGVLARMQWPDIAPARGGRRAGPPGPGRPGARLQVEAAGGRRP